MSLLHQGWGRLTRLHYLPPLCPPALLPLLPLPPAPFAPLPPLPPPHPTPTFIFTDRHSRATHTYTPLGPLIFHSSTFHHFFLIKMWLPCIEIYSLYSTATQNPSRWGFALGKPPTREVCGENTNMLVFKKPAEPTRTLKFVLPPTRTPNAKRWNIGRVGSSRVGARVGHVHFMIFVLTSFALGTQRKPFFLCGIWAYELLVNILMPSSLIMYKNIS